MTLLSDTPTAPQTALLAAAYPPPYLLTGDLLWCPVTVPAGSPPRAPRGRALGGVLAADYHSIRTGPQRTLVTVSGGRPYRYREVAWAEATGVGLPLPLQFGRLWVDAPTMLPIELGDVYGFPKQMSSVAFSLHGPHLSVSAGGGGSPAMVIETGGRLPLPGWLARLTPSVRAAFPSTGLRATLAVVAARSVQLQHVRRWECTPPECPELRPLGWGLLLRGATVFLGAPERH